MVNDIFKDKHLGPRLTRMVGVDEELVALIQSALLHVTPPQLNRYMQVLERYDGQPANISLSHPGEFLFSGATKRVYWHSLRECLGALPSYFDAMAQCRMTSDGALTLLANAHKASKYDFSNPFRHLRLLTRTAELCAEKNIDFPNEQKRFEDLFVQTIRDGELERAIGIFNLGIAAGFTVDQGVTTVENIYEYGWSAGYVMRDLYDELNSLRTHHVDTNLLFESIQHITKTRGDYTNLTYGLYYAFSKQGNPLAENLLCSVNDEAQRILAITDGETFLPAVMHRKKLQDPLTTALHVMFGENGSVEVAKEDLSPEDYFPDIGSPRIVHGMMPYRVKRSLADGIADLRARSNEDSVEGSFVFDPKNEVWYSLGGRTKQGFDRVRHERHHYDISRLAAEPLLLHVHPECMEIYLVPPRDLLTHTCMQKRLTKFFAAVPSAADFQVLADEAELASASFPLRGMIVTSSGLTMYKAPNDPERIKAFAETFQNLKDQTLLDFDVDRYLARGGFEESDESFARAMVGRVNERLPQGFEIKIFPYETLFSPEPEARAQGSLGLNRGKTNPAPALK